MFVWILALTGLLLIFLEFFLPSAIMAIGGVLLLLTSLLFFYAGDSGLFSLLVYSAFLFFAAFLVIWIARWKVKASKNETVSQEGFQALIYARELIGKTGIAATDLRPLGQIRVEEENFEAVSKTGPIEKGAEVQILSGEGGRLLVKAKN